MGRNRDELYPGLKSFPVGKYIIFYLPISDGLEIVRILHGMRDIDTFFLICICIASLSGNIRTVNGARV